MSFQTPITIAQAIRNIEANAYLLPAIQREFVWGHEQIERLFDSIMRKYPISSFLFWRVSPESSRQFAFYRFLRNYQERYQTHNEEHDTRGMGEFTAVLDGQQRLTALFIGLKGFFAYRKPRLHEEDSERVYPRRRLCLRIVEQASESHDDREYDFRFLTSEELSRTPDAWFEVGQILTLADDFEFSEYLDSRGLKGNKYAYRVLSRLKAAIHNDASINFFLETDQALDKALNIFIRINSGGDPLDFSDLVMSIAVARWNGARKEIHGLVDQVGALGFTIKKDFVLKVALLRYSADIRFKVDNFGGDVAEKFRDEWDSTRQAIVNAFKLIRSFGHNNQTLMSKNAVLPIILYLIESGNESDYVQAIRFKEDRATIRRWLNTVLLNRNFGTHSDQLLKWIRDAIRGKCGDGFPLELVANAARDAGKGHRTDDEFLGELLLTSKQDSYAFALLSLLYPDVNLANQVFHLDHLHPASGFTSSHLEQIGVGHDDQAFWLDERTWNSILNLQLLEGRENEAKNAAPLREWVEQQVAGMASESVDTFCRKRMIPVEGLDLLNFRTFIEKRRELILETLRREMV